MNILLVDDDQSVLKTLDFILDLSGITVLHAPSGQKALSLVGKHYFNLIVLDMVMPGMSGMEVLRILQERPETSKVPVIILSGETDPKLRRQASDLGAVAYITKPFDLFHFREVVNRVCPIFSLKQQVKTVVGNEL